MKIRIISKDKIENGFAREAVKEYAKRLARYCRLELKFTKDPGKFIRDKDYVIKVARGGAAISSEELAEKISSLGVDGMSYVVIVFDEDYKRTRVDYSLEISQMDLHKDLMLVILYEQIYRAYRIINKEPYHK